MDWESLINGLALLGVPLVILIPLVLQAFRSWGMPTTWTGPVAVALGMIAVGLIQAVKQWPIIEAWVAIPVYGFLVGFAANGAYSQVSMWKQKLTGTPILNPNKTEAKEKEASELANLTGAGKE